MQQDPPEQQPSDQKNPIPSGQAGRPGRPRKRFRKKDLKELRIRLAPDVVPLVQALVDSGLFGHDEHDVAERLFTERLRELVDWEDLGKVRFRRQTKSH